MSRKIKTFLLVLFLIVVTQTIFFDIYRSSAFDVIPRDDYSYYLLYMIDEEEGHLPVAPYAYRAFSVAAAIPFYYILPYYQFTNLKDASEKHLKATEALSIVSYLSILASSIVLYLLTKKRFGGSEFAAITALLSSFLLFRHTATYQIDPLAILIICLALYYIKNEVVFSLIILASIGFNEKIFIVFTILMLARLIFKTQKFKIYHLSPILAAGLYFAIVSIFDIAGTERQLQPTTYFSSTVANLLETFSKKGLFLNIIPTGIIAVLYCLSLKENKTRTNKNDVFFTNADIIVLAGLFFISHAVRVDYNVGRIAMYCFPLYLPLASVQISKLLDNKR